MAELTKSSTSPKVVGPTAASRQFWAVADIFRNSTSPWRPANAGYELWCTVTGDGRSWSVCMKVHVIPGPPARGSPFMLKASITLWPTGTGDGDRRTKASWRQWVQRLLGRAGYRGKWAKSPQGTFGDFWKDLAGPAAVGREAKRLENLRLDYMPLSRK